MYIHLQQTKHCTEIHLESVDVPSQEVLTCVCCTTGCACHATHAHCTVGCCSHRMFPMDLHQPRRCICNTHYSHGHFDRRQGEHTLKTPCGQHFQCYSLQLESDVSTSCFEMHVAELRPGKLSVLSCNLNIT